MDSQKEPPVVLESGPSVVESDPTTDTASSPKQSPRLSAVVIEESMSLLEEQDGDVAVSDDVAAKTTDKSVTKEVQDIAQRKATKSTKSKRPATNTGSGAEAVSVERKEELLLEARVNRLQWIHQVPLPYRKVDRPDDPWVTEAGLAKFLQTCHAAALMPSTTQILSHLYGLENKQITPEQMTTRIESLLGSLDDDDSPHSNFVRPGQQLLESEIAKHPEGTTLHEVLIGHHEFWTKLQQPECSSLVQGMRTAIRKLDDTHDEEAQTLEQTTERLLSYLTGTFESMKAHAAWKKSAVNDRVKHSLESFIYGQCHSLLQSKLWTDEAKKAEEAWMGRLEALSFVTPQHLDIPCLTADDLDLNKVLVEPIDALLSVDLYYSPYEKLQRILAMYRGVNSALTKSMNKNRKEGESEKLPSADDVLPTMILTVLKAKPARIHANLRLVEVSCPPEYLRGEAGYACTNLFGGVQFLLDLDMEDPKSLSINSEEFRKGLEASRTKFKDRLDAQRKRAQLQTPKIDIAISLQYCDIPASEIRQARLGGETVDLEWAMKWQKQKMAADAELANATTPGGQTSGQASGSAEEVLPPGFTRTYTFLTARPEDIRMSDLPQLLSEYRMLVHTSETLLGERASRLASERKTKVNKHQEALLANIRRVDPSLLPDNLSSS